MRRIISIKEINLLKNSKVTKNYPILIDFINERADLTVGEIQSLDKETQRFFESIYPEIIKVARSEWDTDIEGIEYSLEKKRCQLCNRSMRNVCLIENKYNGKTLIIGPGCVKEFDSSKGININKILAESRKEKYQNNSDIA